MEPLDSLDLFIQSGIEINELYKKHFLITGGTGLIGKTIVSLLCNFNHQYGLDIKIILVVRNLHKAEQMWKVEVNRGEIYLKESYLIEPLEISEKIDFIIHCASSTQSKDFIKCPVEVIKTNLIGTLNMLDIARKKEIRSMVYLSSMEAYGFTTEEDILDETNLKYLNPLEVRSCYPESKRICENMCVSYAFEYHVPVKSIRLAQTFGYGVDLNDSRVFSQFARSALDGKDIILLTDGKSKRMYLDTFDCVTAILTVLLKGENGQTYNAANKETYCSIFNMAEMVCREIANNSISVQISINDIENKKFPPPHCLYLDTSKIERLGWKPAFGLKEMYKRMIFGWKHLNEGNVIV